jgi:type IV secretion system protein VirD4
MAVDDRSTSGGGDASGPFLGLVAIAGLYVAGIWAGHSANLALHHPPTPSKIPLGEYIRAGFVIWRHPGQPGLAFKPASQLYVTNATAFWVAAVAVWIIGAVLAVLLFRLFTGGRRVGQKRRALFGAPEWSIVSKRSDLTTLAVKGPTVGRTIFGTSLNIKLATEDRHQPVRKSVRRPHPRQGDRGAILGVGPARSGKSQIAISAILEHDWTPAILSSVKTDLIAGTVRRRIQLGDVAIFDPLATTSLELVNALTASVRERAVNTGTTVGRFHWVGWSPITAAMTVSGAQRMARRLVEAAPMDDSVNDRSYWQTQAERLTWPMLHAAAIGQKNMADVVRWIVLGDQPQREATTTIGDARDNTTSEVGHILTNWSQHHDPDVAHGARLAHETLQGIWALPSDTRGGVYSSAQTLLKPWEDPIAAHNATIEPQIDLAWLFAGTGRNTLYVVMPPNAEDAKRFAVIFGGLLGELTDQVFACVNRTSQPVPDLMFVLDEAGNSPCDWLPSVATTCASNGLTLITLWQSLAQAEAAFGKRTDTLLTNHLTKIIFGGTSDQATLDAAARLTGQHEVLTHSLTDGAGTNQGARRSLTANTTSASLLAADLVRQIPAGQALCIHGTLPPIHLHTRRWWRDKDLRARHEGTAPVPPPLVLPTALIYDLFNRPTTPLPTEAPIIVTTLTPADSSS